MTAIPHLLDSRKKTSISLKLTCLAHANSLSKLVYDVVVANDGGGVIVETAEPVAAPHSGGTAALIASHAFGYWHPAIGVAALAISC